MGEGPATADEVAAGAARACEKVCGHLARVVGDAGVAALFQRSLALSRRKVPWLAVPPDGAPSSHIRAALRGQPPDQVLEASATVVVTLVEVIGRFIGPDLTLRLLREVWPEVSPGAASKETT